MPGFEYYSDDLELVNYDNQNIIFTSNNEFIFYNIKTKKLTSRLKISQINNEHNADIENFIIQDSRMIYKDGSFLNFKDWKFSRLNEWYNYRMIKPIGDEEYLGIRDNSLYKFKNEESTENKLFIFGEYINDYFKVEDVIFWIDSNNSIHRSDKTEVIQPKLKTNNLKIKEVNDYVLIYNTEELFIYDKSQKTFTRKEISINSLKANNNIIYILNSPEVYKINLDGKYSIIKVNLFDFKAYNICELDDGLLIINEFYKLIKITEKAEFITEVNFGIPVKSKLYGNKLVTISMVYNGYQLSVYNKNSESEYEDYFEYERNEQEKLPFHMGENRVFFLEDLDNTSKIVMFDVRDYSSKEYSFNSESKLKLLSSYGNKFYAFSYDSMFYSFDILTDKLEIERKLDFNIEYIKTLDEEKFWCLIADREGEYEIYIYNLSKNEKEIKFPHLLTISYFNLDYPIYIDDTKEYIIASSTSSTYHYDLKNKEITFAISNNENAKPPPLMPYQIENGKFIVFHRNGNIMKYEGEKAYTNKTFLEEINTYKLDKELSVANEDYNRLLISNIDKDSKSLIYNINGSIVRNNYTLSNIDEKMESYIFNNDKKGLVFKLNELIELKLNNNRINSFSLVDINGLDYKDNVKIKHNILQIEGLSRGIYFISINRNSEVTNLKLLIN